MNGGNDSTVGNGVSRAIDRKRSREARTCERCGRVHGSPDGLVRTGGADEFETRVCRGGCARRGR